MSSGPDTPTFPPNPTPFGFRNLHEKRELSKSSNLESVKDEIEDEIEDFTPTEGRPTSISECREIQWAAGFATSWYPGGLRNSKATLLPWHVFLGVYMYALAVATAATGILEKVTFLQTHHLISRYSTEALMVNSLGILIVVLGGFVTLALLAPSNSKSDVQRDTIE